MGVEIYMLDAVAHHKYSTNVTIIAIYGKFKIVLAHKAELAATIALETEFLQKYSLVQKLHLHFFAVMLGRFVGDLLGPHRLDPIKAYDSKEGEPENEIYINNHDGYRQGTIGTPEMGPASPQTSLATKPSPVGSTNKKGD
jgi:hypothetical protein